MSCLPWERDTRPPLEQEGAHSHRVPAGEVVGDSYCYTHCLECDGLLEKVEAVWQTGVLKDDRFAVSGDAGCDGVTVLDAVLTAGGGDDRRTGYCNNLSVADVGGGTEH